MFRPTPMKRVDILVLSDNIDELTESLGRLGVIHLMDVKPSADEGGLREVDSAAEIAVWRGIEERAIGICRMLDIPEREDVPPTPKRWASEKLNDRLGEIHRDARGIVARKTTLEERLKQLGNVRSEVESFALIDAQIERINDFSFLHFAVGSVSELNVTRLRERCESEESLLLPFRTPSGESKLVAITTKKKRWGLESDLAESGFQKEDISDRYRGMPKDILRETQAESEKASKELEEVEAKIPKFRDKCADEVLSALARGRLERQILEAKEHFGRTENTFLISGWVPSMKMDELREKMQEMTKGESFIQARDPSSLKEIKEGRMAVPILMDNPTILKPFEKIITTYGFPTYNEIEPTLFVALSFLLMFGLMFGDLGQGLVIALMGLALYKIPGLRKKCGDTGIVFVGAGISSALFGVLYGSVFGSESVIKPLWQNPMDDIMVFFKMGVCVGMGMIFLGLIINIINCLKRKDYLHGVFDKLGVVGAIFYAGCIGMTIKHIILDHPVVSVPQILLSIVAPLVILFFREPIYNIITHHPGLIHGNVAIYVMESLVEIMETLASFLANTVSFVRVSAFALSHVGLSIAVFALADTLHKASGMSVSWFFVVVLGNVLIVALEGMIATIQTIRLEYYEFFSKFFGGTGEKFEPFFISK